MMRADLHMHTYYSDGSQSPADVVAAAKRYGVDIISVTDHDNAVGADEVKSLAEKAGISAVDGEEISAYSGDVKIHILGYNTDRNSEEYKSFHKKLYDGAIERTFDILKKLSACGVKISFDEVVRERKCSLSPVHATHIAVAGTRKGYASSPWDFYSKYLNRGSVGFSIVGRPTPQETVKLISDCGGISSLAHPARIAMDKDGVEDLVRKLKECNLSGIEAVYSGHTDGETQYYKEMAERFSLFVTGGSDTHRTGGTRRIGLPVFYPDGKLLSALKIY